MSRKIMTVISAVVLIWSLPHPGWGMAKKIEHKQSAGKTAAKKYVPQPIHNVPQVKAITPLMIAAQDGDLEKLRELSSGDAKLNATDTTGKRALQYALENQQRQAAVYLVAVGAAWQDLSEREAAQLLSSAAEFNIFSVVKELVNAGIQPDVQPYPHTVTALMHAARHGNMPMIKFLIESGADVQSKDRDGLSVLSYALMGMVHARQTGPSRLEEVLGVVAESRPKAAVKLFKSLGVKTSPIDNQIRGEHSHARSRTGRYFMSAQLDFMEVIVDFILLWPLFLLLFALPSGWKRKFILTLVSVTAIMVAAGFAMEISQDVRSFFAASGLGAILFPAYRLFALIGFAGAVYFYFTNEDNASPGAHSVKQCSACKRQVSASYQAGDRCPFCGVRWDNEHDLPA